MMIKSLIFVVCYLSFVAAKVEIPPELKDWIVKIHETCLQQGGLTEEDFKKFEIPKKDPKMMCYIQCLLTESKWITSDEVFQYDYIKESVHDNFRHIVIPDLERCGNAATGTEACEKSYNFYHCMYLASPDVGGLDFSLKRTSDVEDHQNNENY